MGAAIEIDNRRMLVLAYGLGFRPEGVADRGEVRVSLALAPPS